MKQRYGLTLGLLLCLLVISLLAAMAQPVQKSISLSGAGISGVLPINRGGSGATTASGARTAFGIGSVGLLNSIGISDVTGLQAALDAKGDGDLTGLTVTSSSGALTVGGSPCTAGACTIALGLSGLASSITGLSGTGWVKLTGGTSFGVNASIPYADISGTPTLGTAAILDVPASGDASSGQVVKGSDTRLTNSRAPTGAAGGSLTGTYPNPTLATGSVGSSQIVDDSVGSADLAASLALAGVPTAPTAAVGTNTTQIATTAGVRAEITDRAVSFKDIQNKSDSEKRQARANIGAGKSSTVFTFAQTIEGTTFSAYPQPFSNSYTGVRLSENVVAVSETGIFELSAEVRGGDLRGNNYSASAPQYLGIAPLDYKQRTISPNHVLFVSGSARTTFAANPDHSGDGLALKNGDTQFCVADGTGWYRSSAVGYYRHATWWPDAGGTGYSDGATLWPPYTYSRLTSSSSGGGAYPYDNGMWTATGSGNCFTLSAAWTMGNIAVGVPVANSTDGSNYQYVLLSNISVPLGNTSYSTTLGGMGCNTAVGATQFWCGTAFLRGVWIPNITGTTATTFLNNLTLTVR